MHYYLSPGLLCENEIVPNEFNNSQGRLKCHWHHRGVRSLPALYMAAGDLHSLIQVLLLHPFYRNTSNCQGSVIPQQATASCRRYLRGVVPMWVTHTETQRLCHHSSEMPNISSCLQRQHTAKGTSYTWQSRMMPLPHKYVAAPTTTSI